MKKLFIGFILSILCTSCAGMTKQEKIEAAILTGIIVVDTVLAEDVEDKDAN